MLLEVLAFLVAALAVVPFFKRFGLGAIPGYIVAGALIGPSVLGVVGDVDELLHFSELGVVFLLFVIGLELEPKRLWRMRNTVFGLGGSQVLISSTVIGLAALALGQPPRAALAIGLALGLSSTAFATQVLAEKNEFTTEHGRAAFGVLLFQDIAAIPIIAIVPFLAGADSDSSLSPTMQVLVGFGALGLLGGVGRFAVRPWLRFVSSFRSRELVTAAALLVVVASASLMEVAGLSMALGAFIAGVLLADSEYAHELEATIEPFKGLLLGLFFLAVGMSADLGTLISAPHIVVGLAVGLLVVKAAILFGLGRAAKLGTDGSLGFAASIAQGGEFALVVFAVAGPVGLIEGGTLSVLITVVTLSMLGTPVMFAIRDRLVARRDRGANDARPFDELPGEEVPVLIAGFGRFGQIVGRVLRMKEIAFTALDSNPQQVDLMRRFGNLIHYGDPTRPEILHAAKADSAKVLILAVEDFDTSMKVLDVVQKHYPHLRVIARARNRQHGYALRAAGVETVIRETFASSLEAAERALTELGYPTGEAIEAVRAFREFDEARFEATWPKRDDVDALKQSAESYARELETIFRNDMRDAA